jgi:DmsE family decaheme c-type cytochrome
MFLRINQGTRASGGDGMSTVSVEAVSARAWTFQKRQILSTAQAVIAAGAFFGLALTANAASQDEFADLRGFVQSTSATPARDSDVAALTNFLREKPAPQAATVKVAEADNLFDALRQWSGQPAQTPAVDAQAQSPAKRARAARAAAEATLVDDKVCSTCHAAQTAEFNKTLMGKIGLQKRGMFSCQNCHGAGSEHVKAGGGRGVGGILSFGADDPRPVSERNAICLGCHQKGERTYWAGSVHETRDVACTNCHTVMKSVSRKYNLKTVAEMETCFQCHQLQRAQMQRSSHMPVREGKITCSDCHNPHGSVTEKLIRQASINENCYKCHAEKRGPFIWEHAPVNENCLNCHNPHGSNYEYLLTVARPRLCNECHSTVHAPTAGGGLGLPNTPYTLGRACGNCHSNIHGSSHPQGQYFLR